MIAIGLVISGIGPSPSRNSVVRLLNEVVPRRKFDIVAAWSIVRGQDGGSSGRQRVRITDSLLIHKEHASNASSLSRRNSLIPCQIKIDLPDTRRRLNARKAGNRVRLVAAQQAGNGRLVPAKTGSATGEAVCGVTSVGRPPSLAMSPTASDDRSSGLPTGPIRIEALTQPIPRLGDRDALDLYLPGPIGETADDECARRLMCAQHCCAAGSHQSYIGGVAYDSGDLHQILDLHASSPQLRLQIAPRQRTLRLGVFWDAAVGGDADLPAKVQRAGGTGHLNGIYSPAGAGASAALMSRRCIGSLLDSAASMANARVTPTIAI